MNILSVGLMVCDITVKPVSKELMQVDLLPAEVIRISTGGDAFNVASNLIALGEKVDFVSAVGNDIYGCAVCEYGNKLGISLENVKKTDDNTSVAAVLIEPDGERHFVVQKGAGHRLKSEDIPDELLWRNDLLYIGSIGGFDGFDGEELRDLLLRAKNHNMITVADATGTMDGEMKRKVEMEYPYLDIFIPSMCEARKLSGRETVTDCAAFFAGKGIRTVIIKDGKNGAFLFDGDVFRKIPAFRVKAKDTTGAGDAFVAGFLAAFSRGYDLEACIRTGNAAGAICVTRVGSSGNLPGFRELEEYVEKGGRSTCDG